MSQNIYNEEIKQKFLDTYENEGTKNTIKYIFFYSYLNEVPLNKDLYDFSKEEIGKIVADSQPKSLSVAKTKLRFIHQYISWAISNNYRRNSINPLQNEANDDEWLKQFVDPQLKMFISKNDVNEFTTHLVNYQDIVIMHLIFNGVYGHSSTELRNLKITDINEEEKTLRLYDEKKGERYIQVDEDLINLIHKANNEPVYQSSNGRGERQKESDLIQNEFVIRPARRGRVVEHNPATQITIINRIKTIAEEFDMEDLTPKGIQRSGMIYMAYKLLKESGRTELNKQDYEKIGDHFNLSKIHAGEYSYHNRSVMGEYINIENIKKLYPDF
jgi:integrase